MKDSTFSVILSYIAIFFGIVAIYTTRPYNWELNFVGTTITILTFLVTILIGWNIYSVIDVRGRITKTEQENEKYKKQLEDKIRSFNEKIYIVECESKTFAFYNQAVMRLNSNKYLVNYNSLQTSLYYALQISTNFAIETIDAILEVMELVIRRRNEDKNRDDKINETVKLEIKNNMELIVKSKNQYFSMIQRRRFNDISRNIEDILSNLNN